MIRNTLDIMTNYVRLTYGSRATLIFQIAMPLLFTFLIGQASGGFGGSSTSSVSVSWTLAIANEDEGRLGGLLQERLEADPTLDLQLVDAATAVAAVEAEEAVAALIIPADFSRAVRAGQAVSLDFYSDPAQVQQVQPVAEAVRAGLGQLRGAVQAAAVSAAVAGELGLLAQPAVAVAYEETAVETAVAAWDHPPVTVQVNEDERVASGEDTIPSGVNQSSPGMMAMFVTFGMLGGAAVLIQERQWGTLRRLAVMPIPKGSILGGKFAGIVLAGVAQMIILILAGALLFQVDWGRAPLGLALMVGAFALAMSALGVLMAALVKTSSQADALSTILVLSMSALGGAWWPIEIVPDWMQTVARLSPIYWAMSGFHDMITRGLGAVAVVPEAVVLLVFTAVFLLIGVWRFRYE